MPNSRELNTNSNAQAAGGGEPGGSQYPSEDAGVYGVLKCYFYTPKRGDIWGAFCFLFNGLTGESMENVFWVTRGLVGPAIDVNMHWKTLNKMIPQMGAYEKSLGEKLSVLMLESFSAGSRLELCQNSTSPERLEEISGEIRNGFERATHCFLEFKVAFERMGQQDLAGSGVLGKEDVPEPQADKVSEEKSFAGTLINCLPVIDPVHGKPVSELQPDDIMEVKLQGGVGAGELIYKFLESTNQDAVFPIDRIEKDTSSATEKTYIFLKINDEVQGIVTVTKDLRLRVLSARGGKRGPSITFNMDNLIFFGILAAAFLVIALVLNSLIFS